ncbi:MULTISPECIES: TetR/AcrR family transcriptional regulator [Amycolatopsis]|uniref:TetR/AcrR family transcriptional regulator n=1 Tax=Amycolatopsis thermalba TaxID=944492 RepID=A0ABY4NVE0_9PSEU|nr:MULTISPECIES: TetR/AcrR family transcriptional regulator [Amycolatopsis]OXM71938.1 TetR family transcriptional regulator [Amycolatopsis sp. KNN50.9b]UQS24027.1 TetR/AcrR family transcriptional regulator [Amycolatopsis thermalba]
MPRPIDPVRRRARRLQIIDAALTAFALHGYAGATTAEICRIAGIGSGTFFHHFPTKDSLLVAILEEGTEETRRFFAAREPGTPARQVILGYVGHAVADLADPRAAGFITVVGGLTSHPDIAAALRADEDTLRAALREVVAEAQHAGEVRTDLPADRLAVWIMLLIDGFAGRTAGGGFEAAAEAPLLVEQVGLLLDGPPAD